MSVRRVFVAFVSVCVCVSRLYRHVAAGCVFFVSERWLRKLVASVPDPSARFQGVPRGPPLLCRAGPPRLLASLRRHEVPNPLHPSGHKHLEGKQDLLRLPLLDEADSGGLQRSQTAVWSLHEFTQHFFDTNVERAPAVVLLGTTEAKRADHRFPALQGHRPGHDAGPHWLHVQPANFVAWATEEPVLLERQVFPCNLLGGTIQHKLEA